MQIIVSKLWGEKKAVFVKYDDDFCGSLQQQEGKERSSFIQSASIYSAAVAEGLHQQAGLTCRTMISRKK